MNINKYQVIESHWQSAKELQDILNNQIENGYLYVRTMGNCMVFEYDDETYRQSILDKRMVSR